MKLRPGFHQSWSRNIKKDIFNLQHKGKYNKLEMNTFLNYEKGNSRVHSGYTNKYYEDFEENLLLNTTGTYSFYSNILSLGYEIEQNKVRNLVEGVQDDDYKKWNMSLFAEDDWFVTDDLTLTFGARVNKDEAYGLHFTPRLYANYHLNENFVLKGGVAGGFKNPTIDNAKGKTIYTEPTIIFKNPDLKPESSLNFEVGFNFANNKNFNLDATTFVTNFKDKIEFTNLCLSPNSSWLNTAAHVCNHNGKLYHGLYTNLNVGAAKIYGLELSLNYNMLDNLNLRTNYTYSKNKITKGAGKGEPINGTPNHMLNIGVDYQALNNLNLWTQVNFKSKERKEDYSDRLLGSYTTVDLGATYSITKKAKIRAGVSNLFDANINNKEERRRVPGTRFDLGLNVAF